MPGLTDKKCQMGMQSDQWLADPLHRPKAGDLQPTQTQSPDWPHNQINSRAACRRPHPKAQVLKISYLAQAHRTLQDLLAL